MKVVVDQQLHDYMINHEHHVLTVQAKRLSNRQTPMKTKVRYIAPRDVNRFDAYRLDDITVYVQEGLNVENDILKLSDRHLFGIHKCQVSGIKKDESSPLDPQ